MATRTVSRDDGRKRGAGLKRLLADQAGGTMVYIALTLPVFIGAAGLAVDVSSWYTTKRTMQSGVDAAAYAAALNLAGQGLAGTPDLSAVQAAADDAADRNSVVTPVTIHNPPTSGLAAGDDNAVEVIATQAAPNRFTALFLDAPPITARAVAKAVVSDGCVWSLHPTAQAAVSVAGTADIELGCGVVVNSDHPAALEQTGTSCLTASSVSVHGDYSGSCVNPEPEVFAPDYGDPLSYLVEPTYGACDYPSQVVIDASSGGGGPGGGTGVGGGGGGGGGGTAVPLTPGVYCGGIDIQSADVVFAPGLYIIVGGEFRIAATATVTNTEDANGGVTFYLTGSGTDYATVTIQGGADVTLTPMTVPPLANVLFFQDRSAPAGGTNAFTGGSTMDLTGMLYFFNQNVEFTGGSSTNKSDVAIVSSTVTFSGNTYLNADYAKSLMPQQYYARLVE